MINKYIPYEHAVKAFDEIINKCEAIQEAKALFKAKEAVTSQVCNLIDLQPVRHGKWDSWGRDTAYNKFYRCSCCNYEISMDVESRELDDSLPKYCLNCGARMEGEENV